MVIFMMNSKRYKEAQKISDDLMQKISTQNRRALDLVAAKCYYYHARSMSSWTSWMWCAASCMLGSGQRRFGMTQMGRPPC